MKIELSVPTNTPMIIANEKLRILSPPRTKIATRTMSVDTEVFTVRARVSLIEVLNSCCKLPLGCSFKFSRIRSITTTESFTSYPITVSMAPMNVWFISSEKPIQP